MYIILFILILNPRYIDAIVRKVSESIENIVYQFFTRYLQQIASASRVPPSNAIHRGRPCVLSTFFSSLFLLFSLKKKEKKRNTPNTLGEPLPLFYPCVPMTPTPSPFNQSLERAPGSLY